MSVLLVLCVGLTYHRAFPLPTLAPRSGKAAIPINSCAACVLSTTESFTHPWYKGRHLPHISHLCVVCAVCQIGLPQGLSLTNVDSAWWRSKLS